MEWVSVKDGLPKDDREVLVYCDGETGVAYYDWKYDNKWEASQSIFSAHAEGVGADVDIYEPVTHWAELPTPPQE